MSSINIAIVGCISSGKSTLLNAIFVEQYSNMRIKRDTMVPQVYKETDDKSLFKSKADILKLNSSINKKYQIDSETVFTKEDCKEIIHHIPKNNNFINMPDNIYINYYDIPGLNDCSTKDIYYEWFDENFYKFDIIIYIVDINSAMNTSDERDILNKVKDNIMKMKQDQGRSIKLIVLVNKCDDLYVINDVNDLSYKKTNFTCRDNYFTLDDDELDEMYKQIISVFNTSLKDTDIKYEIIPISAIDIFVYRHLQNKPDIDLDVKLLKKFGENEFGKRKWKKMNNDEKKKKIYEHFNDEDNYIDALKNTGYINMIESIKDILNVDNQYKIFSDKIKNKLKTIEEEIKIDNIDKIIDIYKNIQIKIININGIYKQTYSTELYAGFIKNIKDNINYLVDNYFDLDIITKEDLQKIEDYKDILKKFYFNDDLNILLDNKINHLCNLQNEYYINDINDCKNTCINFPNNLINNYLEKLNQNKYNDFKNLIDNIFTICFKQKDIDNDFVQIYFEHEEENRLIKFCKYVHTHYKYPLTNIMDNLEKWLLNRYIIYREIDDEEDRYDVIYPYLINSKLTVNNFYKEDNNPFYNKLYIMNLGAFLFDLDIGDLELIKEEDLILQVFNYYREICKENHYIIVSEDEESYHSSEE